MRIWKGLCLATILAVIAIVQTGAVTRVPSADGQFWDIQDTSPWAQDSGGIATGGRANPFNGFGYLKLQVRRADNSLLARNQYLRGFGLHHDGAGRFDSIDAGADRRHSRGARCHDVEGHSVPPLLRRIHQRVGGRADRSGRVRRRGRRLRRWRTGRDRGNVERRSPHRSDGRLRDRHAEREQEPRIPRSALRATVRRRTWSGRSPGVLTSIGDMYGDPFVDAYPGFDPAHIALRLYDSPSSWRNARARHLRREGVERGLRSSRRLSDSVQGCARDRRSRLCRGRTQGFPPPDPKSSA